MTDKPVTVTPELLPCRKCGAICRVETWAASEVLMTETNLWMCSESTLFDGECDGDAYVSAEAWNTRTAHAPSQHSDLADDLLGLMTWAGDLEIGDWMTYNSSKLIAALRQSPDTVRRDAVIEECAKVADGFNVTPAFDLPCSPFDRTEAIAAAIRALATKSENT